MARIPWILASCLALGACGERTDIEWIDGQTPSTGARPGTGSAPGYGGYVGVGGSPAYGGYVTAGGYPSYGGYVGYGGYPSYGGYVGYGGYPSYGGYVGYGGYPSYGGYVGYGGYPSYGGYVGYGGYPSYGGYGATAGTSGCINCPNGYSPDGTTLWACCMATGMCGVDPSAYVSILPILPACMSPQKPGPYEPNCPALKTSAGYIFDPCCAIDGTCGISLDGFGLGCQSDTQFGVYQPCGAILPPPPMPGPQGSGGSILK